MGNDHNHNHNNDYNHNNNNNYNNNNNNNNNKKKKKKKKKKNSNSYGNNNDNKNNKKETQTNKSSLELKQRKPRMMILSNLCYGSSFATLCSQLIVSYFKPTGIRCIIRPWLKHIGFALVYGPLALKTWRYLKNLLSIQASRILHFLWC